MAPGEKNYFDVKRFCFFLFFVSVFFVLIFDLIFDFIQIHGSARKVDRCYSEHTDSWGSGRPVAKLSAEERRREVRERVAENPTAYRENVNPYALRDGAAAE